MTVFLLANFEPMLAYFSKSSLLEESDVIATDSLKKLTYLTVRARLREFSLEILFLYLSSSITSLRMSVKLIFEELDFLCLLIC